MWQPLGVRAELITADLKTHQQAVRDGDFDVARAAWYAEARDAGTFLELVDGRSLELNVSRYQNAAYDRLMDEAGNSADKARRAELMHRAEAMAMQDQPVAPLYFYTARRLVSPKIRGWVDNPRGVHLSRYLSRAP
jgi:oligopeptide transport system substrate-binding protein